MDGSGRRCRTRWDNAADVAQSRGSNPWGSKYPTSCPAQRLARLGARLAVGRVSRSISRRRALFESQTAPG